MILASQLALPHQASLVSPTHIDIIPTSVDSFSDHLYYTTLCIAFSSTLTDWKSDHSDLAEVSRAITSYAGHMKEKSKALVMANPQKRKQQHLRVPDGTCTTPECIAKGQTNHIKDRCWTLHPELRPKRFQPTTVANSESKGLAPVKPATQINS